MCALQEKRECATCTLPENARSFQGVQEISQIYVGNLLDTMELRAFSGSVQVVHSLYSCSGVCVWGGGGGGGWHDCMSYHLEDLECNREISAKMQALYNYN